MEDNLDFAVNDIISQLKHTTSLTRVEPTEDLSKEKLEEFIIKNSGRLITKTLGIVDDVQTYISSAPDSKDVVALAELLKAASASIEALNKVYTSIEKNKTVKEVKQMDIDSKEKINTQDNAVFLLSRKEIMQELMNKSEEGPIVDV
jgi:PBP1b-binding outer membrane lipoprotein LpoB